MVIICLITIFIAIVISITISVFRVVITATFIAILSMSLICCHF